MRIVQELIFGLVGVVIKFKDVFCLRPTLQLYLWSRRGGIY